MAKDQAQTDFTEMARRTQALFKLNGGVAPQLNEIVQVQEGIFEEVASFARNWFQRRNDAAQSAFKALHEVNGAGKNDPAAAMQAITEWQRGSFERLNADFQDWTALCTRCADAAMTAQSNKASGDADLDGADKSSSKAASATAEKGDSKVDGKDSSKSKSTGHATPV